jgi:hypothetical protein
LSPARDSHACCPSRRSSCPARRCRTPSTCSLHGLPQPDTRGCSSTSG